MKKHVFIILLLFLGFFQGCSNSQLEKDSIAQKNINQQFSDKIDELEKDSIAQKNINQQYSNKIDELEISISKQRQRYEADISLLKEKINSLESDLIKSSLMFSNNTTMQGNIISLKKEKNTYTYDVDLPVNEDSYTVHRMILLIGKEKPYGQEFNRVVFPVMNSSISSDQSKIRYNITVEIHEGDEVIRFIDFEEVTGKVWRYDVLLVPIEDI